MTPSYYGYIRTAPEPENGYSYDDQCKAISDYAMKHGVNIKCVFADEKADNDPGGYKDSEEIVNQRQGLKNLIDTLKEGDNVVVVNTNRLWHVEYSLPIIRREILWRKAHVISIQQPKYSIYEKNPYNKFYETIQGALDDYVYRSVGEHIWDASAENAEPHAMTLNDYQSLAQRTANPALTVEQHLLNGALGLCGESGECADIVKKHMAQGHPLDHEHLVDELGDVLWYVAELAAALGVTLDEVAAHNIEKLRRRYPEGFSAERSIHREEYNG